MNSNENINFRGNDPGAVQYGNFINYYSFHPAEDRLNLFPTHIWEQTNENLEEPFLVLDIGCNSGNFTQIVYPFLKKHTKRKVIVLGVDIDGDLITRAEENNQFNENVMYACLDIMKSKEDGFRGHLNYHGKTKFDAVFCLSVTMWIHLNSGDDGLREFLQTVSNLSEMLIIEPQPWKCYNSALKRMKKANDVFPRFKELTLRNNIEADIEMILIKDQGLEKFFETVPTKWNRKICFFKKKIFDYSVKLF